MRTLIRTVLVAVAALAISSYLAVAPAHAGAPPPDKGDVLFVARECASQDGFVDIGGRLKVREFGRSGIVRLRVKWLLYNTDLSAPGIHVAYKRKTQQSDAFPNDGRDFFFPAGKTWKDLVGTDAGYTLVAKVTWVRNHRRDWNKKYTWTYCQ
jgi:hypothetical protein